MCRGAVARDRLARWGATDAEVFGELAGDEFEVHADRTVTRAVTVHAPPAAVWPWIAQLAGRAGVTDIVRRTVAWRGRLAGSRWRCSVR